MDVISFDILLFTFDTYTCFINNTCSMQAWAFIWLHKCCCNLWDVRWRTSCNCEFPVMLFNLLDVQQCTVLGLCFLHFQVKNVKHQEKLKYPPYPLSTVELQKRASRFFRMSSEHTMKVRYKHSCFLVFALTYHFP